MVAQQILVLLVGVRIPAGLPLSNLQWLLPPYNTPCSEIRVTTNHIRLIRTIHSYTICLDMLSRIFRVALLASVTFLLSSLQSNAFENAGVAYYVELEEEEKKRACFQGSFSINTSYAASDYDKDHDNNNTPCPPPSKQSDNPAIYPTRHKPLIPSDTRHGSLHNFDQFHYILIRDN